MCLLFAYVCVRVCLRESVEYVIVQVGQLSPYLSADSTFNISLSCCLIMLVIKSTLLFDSLSLCEADKICYLFVFRGSMFPINLSSHLHVRFITRQCTVSILNYNNTLPPLVLVCVQVGSYPTLKDSSCFDLTVVFFCFRKLS